MSEPFLGQICMVAFNFAPRGFAFCDGLILPINQNQSLFSILGTTYGGDGRTTFALPDLRGRVPVHPGDEISRAEKSGQENVPLTVATMPSHNHDLLAYSDNADNNEPTDNRLARAESNTYVGGGTAVMMRAGSITPNASSGGHPNMQPYLAIGFIIALQGLFPSRN